MFFSWSKIILYPTLFYLPLHLPKECWIEYFKFEMRFFEKLKIREEILMKEEEATKQDGENEDFIGFGNDNYKVDDQVK